MSRSGLILTNGTKRSGMGPTRRPLATSVAMLSVTRAGLGEISKHVNCYAINSLPSFTKSGCFANTARISSTFILGRRCFRTSINPLGILVHYLTYVQFLSCRWAFLDT